HPLPPPRQPPRPPPHVPPPQLQNQLLDPRRGLVRATLRRPVQFHQSAHPLCPVPPQPHIPSLARDPEARAELAHRLLIPLILKHKLQFLFHHHCSLSRACCPSTCRRSFTRVSGMLPVCSV